MQHVMAEHPDNVGLALLPIYSHKKNGRWSEEQAVMKSIANINLLTDHTFSLVFDDRVAT